jgi:hypothetical protein
MVSLGHFPMSSSRIHAGPALPSKGDFLRSAGEGGTYHNDSADLTDREADTSSSGWNQGFGAKRLNEILPPVRP